MPVKKITTSPRARKTNTSATSKISNNDEDTLMEFEQFVSQRSNSSRNKSWLGFTFIIIIIILGALWFLTSRFSDGIEKNYKFKAIYLENGETYYAKVVKEDSLNIYLDDVYYIKITQQQIEPQEEGGEAQVVEVPILVKRGNEIHRPKGLMQINRSKVVAIEEIGEDSEIIAQINKINQQQ